MILRQQASWEDKSLFDRPAQKVAESVRKGISKSETARRFDVNRSTVQRYIKQLDEEGSLAPKQRPGSPPKLNESALLVLEQDLESRPWATHRQRSEFLLGICGIEVSEATICRATKRGLSHSRKKDQQEPASRTSG
jgi:transposase